MTRYLLYRADELRRFMTEVLFSSGYTLEDSQISADVLLSADLRGVESHGIIRLFPYYSHRLRKGLINGRPNLRIISETAASLALDADNGLGHPTGYRAMKMCIEKARVSGVAMATVRNSNHYGIAGYYAMMAMEHDMIGISYTNSRAHQVATYGRVPVLGTNPIAVAVPAQTQRPFVLDMATSIVPVGKITVYEKAGKEIPLGWGTDSTGTPTTDPGKVFPGGGALMPLGGTDIMRGYKGYGLALMVDIFSGVLAGSAFGLSVDPERPGGSRMGHFFAAMRIDAFRPVDEFRRDMDVLISQIKDSPKALGKDRIFIHGEKEFEAAESRLKNGVPLMEEVVESLKKDGSELGVRFDIDPVGEKEVSELYSD
jgi:LDH2 family malate/lactate/ureidoglycolate dehydrogenase